jgi:hypothetical protein
MTSDSAGIDRERWSAGPPGGAPGILEKIQKIQGENGETVNISALRFFGNCYKTVTIPALTPQHQDVRM